LSDTLHQLRAGIGRAAREQQRTGDSSAVTELRREYAAAKITEYVKKTISTAPALTDAQIARISAVLQRGGVSDAP
jgi:hypothetical protein